MLIFVLCNLNYYLPINLKPMEIKNSNRGKLQNMEHFQFAGHVLALCEE